MLAPTTGIPAIGLDTDLSPAGERPSSTYRVDFEAGRVAGRVDGLAAMEQAIYKILETERFAHLIYSWSYGVELGGVVGQSWPVVQSELKRVLREALLADVRIEAVDDVVVTRVDKRTAAVSCAVTTCFGELTLEREVLLYV